MSQLVDKTDGGGADPKATGLKPAWGQIVTLAFLIGFLYYSILGRLVLNWWHDPNYSHGFFVPGFSGFVIWHNHKRLTAQHRDPSWFGLAVIVGALGLLIVGVLGAELFLSRSSFLVLIAGLVIYFMGWSYFRQIAFPWAFLFLMIPIPAIIFNHIAFPLQTLASKLASGLLGFLGVPVLRQGNIIHLPALSLEVAQACSGIRSLMSLGTIAIIYGYFLEPKVSWRVLLAIAAVPIAVLANALRILGTGLLMQYWDRRKAEGFFHTFEGWAIFVLSLLILSGLHHFMGAAKQWWAGKLA